MQRETPFGLACVRFVHVHLLYNAALIFNATFNVLVLPLDVGKRFARLIRYDVIGVLDCGPRGGIKSGTSRYCARGSRGLL